ncbi:SDR family oxidoreductase [candidate division KSB1 bacterium]|nr:SDR family oxidoreductase [candidate division KSB1 bacterium]RQW01583.1 MAG: SDR family oxidoreductase [candidate division KSB1 bacterium]
MIPEKPLILVTGASGYVGGRLIRILEKEGYPIRCLARQPAFVKPRVAAGTEIVQGDVLDKASLYKALEGVQTAFYLIHSMASTSGFQENDRRAAENFAQVAEECRVQRIIYLGGLGDDREHLSPHLHSRQEVGRILRQSDILTIELRASIVIGSGSLSFEMIRNLTEKLPLMVMPQWVRVLAQPIGIDDLLAYLVEAITIDIDASRVFEIGGADQLSYYDLMLEYTRVRELKRIMIPVPVLTPGLSSLWLGLVTPLYARIGRKLIDSIRHPTVVQDHSADHYFSVRAKSARDAIKAALVNEDKEFAETRWSDALSASSAQSAHFGGIRIKSRLVDSRQETVHASAEQAFRPILQIGGKNGWYAWNILWRIRGLLDLLIGGVGMRRGRPEKRDIRVGDTLDFWRVEALESPKYLKLFAEMKLPGKAWLEFEVTPQNGDSIIRQTATFYPLGLAGLLYWYGIYPLHALVFRSMIRKIARRAERGA